MSEKGYWDEPKTWSQLTEGRKIRIPWPKKALMGDREEMPMREGVCLGGDRIDVDGYVLVLRNLKGCRILKGA